MPQLSSYEAKTVLNLAPYLLNYFFLSSGRKNTMILKWFGHSKQEENLRNMQTFSYFI